MQDVRGFLHYPRIEPAKQGAGQRIGHWHEYEQLMPDGEFITQAARCMDCGTPACHCYCPTHNLIPAWSGLARDRDWRGAFEQLQSTSNFPEFTGRLCPAPCEDACTLRLSGAPVTIRGIELAVIEHAWARGWIKPQAPRNRRFQRVAVIGSGPAGLACAQQLVHAGYRVTVYEKADQPGGLLRYGIPDFRLEKWVLERRLAQLVAEGVRFRTGAHVGINLDIDALRRSAHAVVLACGCGEAREVQVPNRELAGIHPALDYLVQQNRCIAGRSIGTAQRIDGRGKNVVVIGGGDTGSDCVGTALRQGAVTITQIQYHDSPPRHAEVRDYWPQPVPTRYPDDHEAEGCARLWGWDTIGFEGTGGRVSRVRLQRMRWWQDSNGHWQRERLPGQIRRLPAQLVVIAIGYAHPVHAGPIDILQLDLDRRGNVAATDTDYRTNAENVFACGDARRGQSLIVWAIREGRQCARSVDLSLRGESDLPRV